MTPTGIKPTPADPGSVKKAREVLDKSIPITNVIPGKKTSLSGCDSATAQQLHIAIKKGEIKLGGSQNRFKRAIELAMTHKELSKKKIAIRWLREPK